MTINEIITWQWQGYTKYHKSKMNLWLHVIFVPVFVFGFLLLVIGLINLNVLNVIISILLMVLSIGVQGLGHSKESIPAEPFTGPKNAITRILLEQLYTFPKFVLSGKWYKTLLSQ